MAATDEHSAKEMDSGHLPANLVQVFRLLFQEPCLALQDRLNVREACRTMRSIHDQAASSLCLGRRPSQLSDDDSLSAEEITTVVQAALLRGCRPKKVSLESAAVAEDIMMAFLSALSGVDSVKCVTICPDEPITESVARAIASGFPKLSELKFHMLASPETAAAAHLLLELVGTKLKGLRVSTGIDSHWPVQMLDPLTKCAALTRLFIRHTWHADDDPQYGLASELSLLRTVSAVTGLRELELYGGARPPADSAARQTRAATLLSSMSALTGLTSLNIGLHCLNHVPHPVLDSIDDNDDVAGQAAELRADGRAEEAERLLAAVTAESRALGAAARCMPHLKELRTRARLYAADLAPLTALTYLRLGSIVLDPPPARPQNDTSAAQRVGGQQQAMRVFDLPPRLQELKLYAPLSVSVAASLRLAAGAPRIFWGPPGLMLLDSGMSFWSLTFSDSHLGNDGRLTAEAVVEINRAVANLKTVFSGVVPQASRGDAGLHLRIWDTHDNHVQPPAPGGAAAGDGTHCGSWLGAMLAQLRPFALDLWGLHLSPRDMLAMTRCMAGLRELDLRGCQYEMAALPLLGGLPAVELLTLSAEDWEFDDNIEPVEAVFLALTAPTMRTAAGWPDGETDVEALYGNAAALPLPRLQELILFCDEGPEFNWLREGLAGPMGELQRRRPSPADLVFKTSEEA